MSKKPVEILDRYRLTDYSDLVLSLEATEDTVWISKTQRGRRYTIRGVPGNIVDVVIVDELNSDLIPVLEVCDKIGKFDGALRKRFTIRGLPRHQAPATCVFATIDLGDYVATFRCGDEKNWEFSGWRSDLDVSSDLGGIVRWHYDRYYRFLSTADVEAVEEEFKNAGSWGTLAEANRLASRMLYKVARDQGWHKLTLREQQRLGLRGQWHNDAEYSEAQEQYQGRYSPTGCGDYTLRSSASSWKTEHEGPV